MKQFIRKAAAALLALSMAAGMSVAASAATTSTNTYSLYVKDQTVKFLLDGKTAASYEVNQDTIELITDREGDFLVCFFDDRGTHKGISLGNQKTLSMSGTISNLRVDDSLNSSIKLTVASDGLIKNMKLMSDNDLLVNGRITDLEVDAASNVEVSSTGTISSADLTHRKAKLHAEKGATVKRVQTVYRTNVTGNVTRVSRIEDYEDAYGYSEYDDYDDDDKIYVRVETDTIYAREGDRLRDLLGDLNEAVYAYVDDGDSDRDGDAVNGRASWRNENTRIELDSSGHYGFTFTPSNSKYRSVRGTVYIVVR